jgi:dTDP-glucose 4,6-dehydratase
VALIAEQMNEKVDITSDTERIRPVSSEVERLWADNSKAKELLGWSPKYVGRDGLVRGLQETINWFTQPENLQRYKSDIYNV